MENQEQKDGKESCCTKGKCCGCKGAAALVIAALVFGGGYLCGKHCAKAEASAPAVSAPATK